MIVNRIIAEDNCPVIPSGLVTEWISWAENRTKKNSEAAIAPY